MKPEKTSDEERAAFLQRFQTCRPVLSAIGDENRQLILRVLIENCGAGGIRVGEIQRNTNISRTAVSHHLKVLKEAGIINRRKEGTKNFYYLDFTISSLQLLSELWGQAIEMMGRCPMQKKEGR